LSRTSVILAPRFYQAVILRWRIFFRCINHRVEIEPVPNLDIVDCECSRYYALINHSKNFVLPIPRYAAASSPVSHWGLSSGFVSAILWASVFLQIEKPAPNAVLALGL
jgi:hypothetical protein